MPVNLKSEFLKEQLACGNITIQEDLNLVFIEGSYSFKNVDYNKRHRHRDKISAALKKEGFIYVSPLDGYLKMSNA